ncbi:MAG: C4-type zinc ribbon domain-containing protein [Porphyromonadaceae bacterium]|nr:C4-type zinc ribbon domain-containing protein [Porphyromonadaceae bacterium]
MATKKKIEKTDDKKEVKEAKTTIKAEKAPKVESSPASQDPQEFSVEERLKALYGLQKVMSKIDEIKILRGDLPLEVQDLKDEIIGLQTRLERYSSEIKELEKSITTSKNSIEELKLKVDRKKEQQQQVVNNREYEILSKEIENIELDIQIYEKNINDANNDINHRKVDYNELTAKIEERNEDLRLKEAELDQIVVETKKEEEELRILSKELESNIDVRLLSAFKRIRKNARNGLAVVPIERNACSGCFSKIPPQRQLDIRQRRKIIVCENCGRIIVDHEMDNEHEG